MPNDYGKSAGRSIEKKKHNNVYAESLNTGCYLNTTSLKPFPEDLLEEGNVIEIHQGVVLAGHVGEGGTVFAAFHITTAEALPGLKLLVHPVGLRSLEGNGVEDVQDLCDDS